MPIHKIDATRLLCPMPVIRLQDAIKDISVNGQVEITCTDPGAKLDIPSWCRINRQRVDQIEESGHLIIITVTKLNDD